MRSGSPRPKRVKRTPLLVGSVLILLVRPLAAADLPVVAVFAFELVDTSVEGEIEGPSEEQQARLALIGDILREDLAASGKFRIIDGAPAAERAGHRQNLRDCKGCELPIAARLGADFALIGWVQKVSNLILNINVAVREVATGRLATGASVDIRGNTDESWSRGMRYLVKHRLLGS